MSRSRRAFLKRVGGVSIGVGLAGCSGETGGETETGGAATGSDTETGDGGPVTESSGTDAGEGVDTGEQTSTETTGTAQSIEGTVVTTDSTNGLNIVEHSFFHSGDAAGVEGVLKNTTDETFEYAEVKVSPVNESGDRAGQFYTSTKAQNVNTLKPGETWNFVVAFSSEWVQDFNKYEIWATGTTQMQGTESGETATETTGTATQTRG